MTAITDAPDIADPLDPYTPAAQQDRYALYGRLRAESPVHLFRSATDPRRDLCLITRHRDVTRALSDGRFVRETGVPRYNGPSRATCPASSFAGTIAHWMVYRDAPHHRRLRDPVRRALHGMNAALRPLVTAVAADVVRELPASGAAEFVSRVGFPVPSRVICRLVGIADDRADEFRAWMSGIGAALERSEDGDAWDAADVVAADLGGVLRAAIEAGRPTPFIGRLRELVGGRVAEDELIANLVLVLFAGFETTLNLICNMFLCLLRHPAQLERVRAAPGAAARAVEECLRYEAPVQMTFRGTVAEVVFGGARIPPGTRVALVLASANRDERVFRDPDRFDIDRDARRHLAFGHRAHFCPGAALGRLEAEATLLAVLGRFRSVRLALDRPEWRPGLTYRALRELPIELVETPRGRA